MDGIEFVDRGGAPALVAGVGLLAFNLLAFKASEVDPESIALLRKVSNAGARVWVQPLDPTVTPRSDE